MTGIKNPTVDTIPASPSASCSSVDIAQQILLDGVASLEADQLSDVKYELENLLSRRLDHIIEEPLKEPTEQTPHNWLSFGRSPQYLPLHTDYPNLSLPPRFIFLECLSCGRLPVETVAFDFSRNRISIHQLSILKSEAWVVTCGIRKRTVRVISSEKGEFCVRFAENVMRPRFPKSSEVLRTIGLISLEQKPWSKVLLPGECLIIDNWRMMHGRREAELIPSNWHPGERRTISRTLLFLAK